MSNKSHKNHQKHLLSFDDVLWFYVWVLEKGWMPHTSNNINDIGLKRDGRIVVIKCLDDAYGYDDATVGLVGAWKFSASYAFPWNTETKEGYDESCKDNQ